MRVKTKLNFRSQPKIDPANLKGTLIPGEPIEILEEGPGNWIRVKTKLNDLEDEGWISSKYTREDVSQGKEALMYESSKWWRQFDFGNGREHISPYHEYVGEMWQNVGQDLDGKDRDWPWSAAFISLCARRAGYTRFPFTQAHSRYINDSIVKRNAGQEADFWGHRINEQKAELGDMVVQWRKYEIDYDHAASNNQFASHCDIITELKPGIKKVRAIGGNVAHTVDVKVYDTDEEGFLLPTNKVIAILKNRN
jgi:hypothetical protein